MPKLLIKESLVRRYALEAAASLRPATGFNRVSADFLSSLDAELKAIIIARIHRHPSRGKTLTHQTT